MVCEVKAIMNELRFRTTLLINSLPGILLLASSIAISSAEDALPVAAEMREDRIVVIVAGKEFTAYQFGKQHKYPFFHPVNGPTSGETVTTWDQEPYPHHSSLYLSLDNVRSASVRHANYWQPRNNLSTGHILSRNPEIIAQDGHRVVLRDRTEWTVPAHDTHQISDTRTITISAPSPNIRIMDFRFDITPEKDLEVGQTGHSFFSARMRSELAVGCERLGKAWAHLGTGTMVNSLGGINEKGTREQPAEWCAAYGKNGEHTEGLAIIQHSGNPMYPAKWFIRDYGFLSPTPFAFDGKTSLKGGETYTFQYRVVVFTGDHESADIAGWHKDFEAKLAASDKR
jgi:hypothetical protein